MTSETMTNAVSIKDYIIDMNNTTSSSRDVPGLPTASW